MPTPLTVSEPLIHQMKVFKNPETSLGRNQFHATLKHKSKMSTKHKQYQISNLFTFSYS